MCISVHLSVCVLYDTVCYSVQDPADDCRDDIIDECQVAHVSEVSIKYGCIPQFAVVHRILFLSNTSDHSLSYSWLVEDEQFNQVMPHVCLIFGCHTLPFGAQV